jgi:hypothetical protein
LSAALDCQYWSLSALVTVTIGVFQTLWRPRVVLTLPNFTLSRTSDFSRANLLQNTFVPFLTGWFRDKLRRTIGGRGGKSAEL